MPMSTHVAGNGWGNGCGGGHGNGHCDGQQVSMLTTAMLRRWATVGQEGQRQWGQPATPVGTVAATRALCVKEREVDTLALVHTFQAGPQKPHTTIMTST